MGFVEKIGVSVTAGTCCTDPGFGANLLVWEESTLLFGLLAVVHYREEPDAEESNAH